MLWLVGLLMRISLGCNAWSGWMVLAPGNHWMLDQ
jgi:hypothetical protein